jgi:hypothetical protein
MKPLILERVESLGHVVFASGAYNINIIGERTPNQEANKFDDRLHLVFKNEDDEWQHLWFECTTDPGTYWLENPGNHKGTAIMVPGQYRGAYKIDKHAGRYDALCQRNGTVQCYRDSNRDRVLDMDPESITQGFYGINIHHAGTDSKNVDKWSAGCTVVGNMADWDVFFSVVKKSADLYGNQFTYTLIEG